MPSLQTAAFLKQMAMLAKAGVPMHQGLTHLMPTQDRKLRPLSQALATDLSSGSTLTDALRNHHAGRLTETQLACIEAGEESGQLENTLKALAEEEESDYHLQQKLITRLAYPVLLIHAAAIIPSIITLVQQSLLLAILETLLWLSPFYLLGIWAYFNIQNGSADAWLLRIPLLGNFLRCSGAARFCRSLAALLRSGTRLEKSYLHASAATGNSYLANRLKAQLPALEQGESVSEILRRAAVFPASSINLLAAGDLSGTLDQTLDYLAEQLRLEAQTSAERLGQALPVLSYALAIFIVLARIMQIFWPMMKALDGISG
jgi:type II secretory pathway component PulF